MKFSLALILALVALTAVINVDAAKKSKQTRSVKADDSTPTVIASATETTLQDEKTEKKEEKKRDEKKSDLGKFSDSLR